MDALQTDYIKVDPRHSDWKVIDRCASIIKNGGLVAFPTETVYGLGANALDGQACRGIFAAKGRPADNPLIVHIASVEDMERVAGSLPDRAYKCMDRFWPGPLTIVVPKNSNIPDTVSAGLSTVAVRMPDHPVALALIRVSGVPIAAPSANTSGRPSPTSAEHVREDLGGKINAILDAGPCRVGVESTVLDLTSPNPVILRPGGISREQLEDLLGQPVAFDRGLTDQNVTPRSPGVKYKHYAPKGEVILLEGSDNRIIARIKQELSTAREKKLKVAILCSRELAEQVKYLEADNLIILGSRQKPETVAAAIYGALRECDRTGSQLILTEGFARNGIGAAIMNRLEKAAGYRLIKL